MALAQMCGGLPLALITVARGMATKRTFREWNHAVNNFTNSPSDFPGMEDDVLIPLKQSYDHLPNDKLRACLLYFALWRNALNYNLDITIYWMVEGLIEGAEDWMDAVDKELYIVGILGAASLLDIDTLVLHPMVLAMALWVARECGKLPNKWLVRYSNNLEKWREAERISLGRGDLGALPDSPECPNLVSMMLMNSHFLTRIPNGFFQFMPCLRVLNLSHTDINDLPPGIGNLVGLQFLELQSTNITCLPEELTSLVKLKYLGLNWTGHLRAIPRGVISALQELLVLDLYRSSFCQWNVEPAVGACLTELESLKMLMRLNLTIGSSADLQWLYESYSRAAVVDQLCIKMCDGLATMHLPSPTFLRNLNCLNLQFHIFDFDLQELFLGCDIEEETEALPCPRFLILENLHRIKIIWRNRGLENIHMLYIICCDQIKVLLHYKDDDNQHEEASRVITAFPNLQYLKLCFLPELRSLSNGWTLVFPALESIQVIDCPNLNKLTLVAKSLREFRCNQSWWNQLEWEDKRIENTFQVIFT